MTFTFFSPQSNFSPNKTFPAFFILRTIFNMQISCCHPILTPKEKSKLLPAKQYSRLNYKLLSSRIKKPSSPTHVGPIPKRKKTSPPSYRCVTNAVEICPQQALIQLEKLLCLDKTYCCFGNFMLCLQWLPCLFFWQRNKDLAECEKISRGIMH